jgi:hypothetical protein
LLDKNGKYIVSPKFALLMTFFDKAIVVLIDKKWGIIDQNGDYIIEPMFDAIKNCNKKDWLKVKIGNRCGVIDFSGNYIIKPQYNNIGNFSEGLAAVKMGDKFGYINEKDEIIIKPQFQEAGEFYKYDNSTPNIKETPNSSQNLLFAKVKFNNKYGVTDVNGKYIIKPEYDSIPFSNFEGLIILKKDNKWGLADTSGKIIAEPKFDEIKTSRGEFISVKIDTDKNGIKYWIETKKGHCINKKILNPNEDINCLMYMDINGDEPPNIILSDQFRIIIHEDRVLSAEEYLKGCL